MNTERQFYNQPIRSLQTMLRTIALFSDEYEAFRAFADIYPDNCILLIDTYDTLGSGIDAAIKVGLEQKAKGKKIGIRIDSGDLSYLTKEARMRLDEAGLEDIAGDNDADAQVRQTAAAILV